MFLNYVKNKLVEITVETVLKRVNQANNAIKH